MPLRRPGDVECDNRQICLSMHCADRIACENWIGWKRAMMRVKQHVIRTIVKLAVGHQLIDISLADALFWIVNLRC